VHPIANSPDYGKKIQKMLVHGCPALRHLRILIHERGSAAEDEDNDDIEEEDQDNEDSSERGPNDSFTLDSLLSRGNWPQLEQLNLEGDLSIFLSAANLQDNTLNSFFRRHPTLRTLRLAMYTKEETYPLILESETLPTLTSLSLLGNASPLRLASGIRERIEHLYYNTSYRSSDTSA